MCARVCVCTCMCTCAIVDCFGSVWKSRNLRNFRCVYYYPVMRANWQTTRKWKWTKLAFIDRRRRRRRWRWRRNRQVWRRFVWMETVSKLPYPPLQVSFSFTKSPTTTLLHNGIRHPSPPSLGQSFCALSSISWWFPTLPTCSQFCGGQRATECVWWGRRRGQWAAAVSPGRNQNLCLDRRLTIAICHKLPERAHNLRMTTQPNKCPAHFSITAKCAWGNNVQTMHVPLPYLFPLPLPLVRFDQVCILISSSISKHGVRRWSQKPQLLVPSSLPSALWLDLLADERP